MTPAMPPLWYDNTWSQWVTTTATTTGNYYYTTWEQWNSQTASTIMFPRFDVYQTWINETQAYVAVRPTPPSPEQIATREAAHARVEEARRLQVAANSRAVELLLESLTPAQRADYKKTKHFNVHTRSGRRYRIACGRQHNVFQLDDKGLAVVEFCGHVGEAVPNEDNILAQKLMLEHNEEAFLRIANRRQYTHPLVV